MRNLALERTSAVKIPSQKSVVTCVAHDVATGDRYAIAELVDEDKGEVETEVWKLAKDGSVAESLMGTLVMDASPSRSPQIVSAGVLAESYCVCLVLAGGGIATMSLEEDEDTHFDVVGDVEGGIQAAAWSPEEELLVIVTGNGALLQMTSSFNVISEASLDTEDQGEEQSVNVGWGSKTTQFHGSAGKTAALSAAAQADAAARGGQSPDDDLCPRISWRGDGAFFAVSTLSPPSADSTQAQRRILRIYNRTAALQTMSEPVPGLEHGLAWKPSGALIASTQRFGFPGGGSGKEDRHDVVFFERNGLRHGEFQLRQDQSPRPADSESRWSYRVKELLWSSDSNVLAVWLEEETGDAVQLWTVNNYHWYLKHVVHPPPSPGGPTRFTSVAWHAEDAMRLTLTTSTFVLERVFTWTTVRTSEPLPKDSGTVAVIDGSTILLTPFRKQNVPPPMSSYTVQLATPDSNPPVDLAFDAEKDVLAVLLDRGSVEIWELHTKLENRGPVASPHKAHSILIDSMGARQVVLCLEQGSVAVLGYDWTAARDVVQIASINGDTKRIELDTLGAGRLLPMPKAGPLLFQKPSGEVISLDTAEQSELSIQLPQFCFQTELILGVPPVLVGLAANGALYAASAGGVQTLASNCTSFVIGSSEFLIYTTSAHEARFVPTSALALLTQEVGSSIADWEQRRVERGSRIVTVVPSTMSLVLQMPRGNLETVNPRPLVLQNVRADINSANYRQAFLACRKHRIDLNILVEHNPDAFMQSIAVFVDQVSDVDHINLFLSGIGQAAQSSDKIAAICDSIREHLEQRDLKHYVNSILTAHVVKTPPDLEAGLRLLLRLRDEDQELVEDAIKYMIFLVDVDRLFDTALGMYDFSLVLMVAQHSQKDPREYLPFLRELRALEVNYQRYRIDDHLERYPNALRHLHAAGDTHFELAKRYIKQHELYTHGLSLWKNDKPAYQELLDIYGDFLFEKREYGKAATLYVLSEKTEKALLAYEKDTAWRELFALATAAGATESRLSEIADRISDKLSSRRRHSEAAQVLLDYSGNVEGAVAALLEGNEFSEAVRIAHLRDRFDLMESHILPGALNAASNIIEDVEEMTEQLEKQIARWDELQDMKAAEPDAFYLQDNPALHNVEVMTEASAPGTAFTRFTVAPSIVTGISTSKSSKGRRKNERKRLSGKKGTVNEEDYLLSSVVKLVTRLHTLQNDTAKLLPHLIVFSDDHRAEASEVQKSLTLFEVKLKASIERLWTTVASDDVDTTADKQAKPALSKPEKPLVDSVNWRSALIHE